MNLLSGIGDQASFPSAHISHNLLGLVASPGNLPEIPMIAIGRVSSFSDPIVVVDVVVTSSRRTKNSVRVKKWLLNKVEI